MVRIFVTSSHISAIYQLIYAKQTYKDGYIDVLLIDSPSMKKSLIDLILDTQKIYPWHKAYSLSTPLPDNTNIKPSTRKTLTRKFKGKPVIKQVYNLLLYFYERRRITKEKEKLKGVFSEYSNSKIELNLLTKTVLNQSLHELYPHASINYFEHGLGDYYYVQKPDVQKGNFYCVFGNSFKALLEKKKTDSSFVHELNAGSYFSDASNQIIDIHPKATDIRKAFAIEGKLVFILMESVEIYHVPINFWTDYINLCLSKINNPQDYTFILKPHPLQSFDAIERTKKYFEDLKLNAVFIDNKYAMIFSAEVLFCLWKHNVNYVFSLFSSSLFYLSKLYPEKYIFYYSGYDFFKKYLGQAPPQYLEIFKGLEEVVNEVTSENCLKMN